MLLVIISCLLICGRSDLIGRWNFRNSLADETGLWMDVQLYGATRSNQGLAVKNNSFATTTSNISTHAPITEKTLISWLRLDDVSYPRSAGSALTFDEIYGDHFDGMIWGERGDYQWSSGSNGQVHTIDTNATTSEINQDVKMAISYAMAPGSQVFISIYKDDQLVTAYDTADIYTWNFDNVDLFWGQRHGNVNSSNGFLIATIYASEIHDVALTQTQIRNRVMNPTPAPTAHPICSTCDRTVNLTSNVSQTLTLGNTVVTVPPNLVDIPNVTLKIIVVTIDAGPPLPVSAGGTSGKVIVSIVLKKEGVELNGTVPLRNPISFVIPFEANGKDCLIPQCVWREGTNWVNSGCEAVLLQDGVQCTCTHLTDFAVLLDQSKDDRCEQSTDVYYPFAALYAAILTYCLVILFLLFAKIGLKIDSVRTLLQNHVLIGLIAVLRLLSCLRYLHVIESNQLVVIALITAAPYPLEFLLFSFLASSWIGLAHYTMSTKSAQWTKVRPLFICSNVIGTICSIGLFVLFSEYASFETAAAGTAVLAVFYFILAIIFQVYSRAIARDLVRLAPASSRSIATCMSCSVDQRIKWVGRVVAASFVLQAICDVVAIVAPSAQLTVWTAIFLSCNLVALLSLLTIYYTAFARVLKTSTRSPASGTFVSDGAVSMSKSHSAISMTKSPSSQSFT